MRNGYRAALYPPTFIIKSIRLLISKVHLELPDGIFNERF